MELKSAQEQPGNLSFVQQSQVILVPHTSENKNLGMLNAIPYDAVQE